MLLPVIALYAGLLALIGQFLGGVVGSTRGRLKIPIGDGGKPELTLANRRHMNFVENVPLLITLLAIVELNGAPKLWIHVMGSALVVARIVHPFGLNMDNMSSPARIFGAAVTALVMVAAAAILLWQAGSMLL
jgi:hypothetical protein